ncbi:MAG: hypothetical protein QGG42_16100 [Phycisphaerae bacterium]|jgi:hypothetical protein|nr:hypothetical protein [Phycisphaerae bacterium]
MVSDNKGAAPSDPETSGSRHHYAFGHIALRQICKTNPLGFFGAMASEDRDRFSREIWDSVCKHCDETGSPAFTISDVKISTLRVADYPAILIRMPPPANTAEAHLIAIVLKLKRETTTPPDNVEFAYFTLEKGVDTDGTERTVLCSWSMDDVHSNYGYGPPVDEREFLAAVEKLL